MSCTVHANGNGFFHKGSSGTGFAFPDVCLSPPPPPAGPIPIPYPNNISASDLTDGSKTVEIEGNPTALKDQSSISTSTGDEGGTQGGNVVTHKTKGKGSFLFWSFDVQVEGKNVACHGDPVGQNCASAPFGTCCLRSKVVRDAIAEAESPVKPCHRKFKRKKKYGPTKAQKDAVKSGPVCWQCKKRKPKYIADHQPPLVVLWYAGGCHDRDAMKKDATSPNRVKPHCRDCSSSQGGKMAKYSKELRKMHGFAS